MMTVRCFLSVSSLLSLLFLSFVSNRRDAFTLSVFAEERTWVMLR